MLASMTDITLSDFDPTNSNASHAGYWDMDAGTLRSLALFAYHDIDWQAGFTLAGSDQTVLLYTQTQELVSQGGVLHVWRHHCRRGLHASDQPSGRQLFRQRRS